jgi:integrase
MASLRNKDGTWYVLWRDGGRGTPLRSVKVGPKKTDAQKVKTEIEHRRMLGRVGVGVLPGRMTFDEWSEKWLASRLTRPKTQDRDRRIVRVHLLPAFRGRLLASLTTQDVAEFNANLTRRVSAWTARRSHAVLRRMLTDARLAGHLAGNPAADVTPPPMPHDEMRLPAVEQFCTLLHVLPEAWRPLVVTLGLCGLRFGEAAALEWSDVDLDAARIHVRRQMPTNTLTLSAPKSRAGLRVVDLPSPVRQSLLDFPQRGKLVFPGIGGGYLNHRWWSKAVWRSATKAAGLDGLRIHDLRHLAASLRLAWGEPLLTVAQVLGHSSAAFTLRQYGHVIADGQRLDREATLAKVADALRRVAPVLPKAPTPRTANEARP